MTSSVDATANDERYRSFERENGEADREYSDRINGYIRVDLAVLMGDMTVKLGLNSVLSVHEDIRCVLSAQGESGGQEIAGEVLEDARTILVDAVENESDKRCLRQASDDIIRKYIRIAMRMGEIVKKAREAVGRGSLS